MAAQAGGEKDLASMTHHSRVRAGQGNREESLVDVEPHS